MKALVSGGGGFVGCVLLPKLLARNYEVTVFDNLMFGGNQLIPFFNYPNFHFVKGDIRDKDLFVKHVEKNDVIIHLAAIVGFPACRKDPILAKEVNVDGTKNLIAGLKDQIVIFASTGSNYGAVIDVCTEDSPLNPLSLYGDTKTTAETLLLQQNAVILRFATAFGISPRLRLDLMINDFAYKCATQGYIIVYESEFKRTFIHVSDMAEAILLAIDKPEMKSNVYNVGDESLNYTKREICDIVSAKTGAYIHYASIGEDLDKRNYHVSYSKLKKLGFQTKKTIEQGIDELIRSFAVVDTSSNYFNA